METEEKISEEELEAAFRDDPEFGLQLLFSDFREQIGRFIQWRLAGLPKGERPEAVKDLLQDTFVELIPFVRNSAFDWRAPLRIVYTIAARRACDLLRRRKFKPKQDIDGAIEQIARELSGTKIGREWRMQTKADWNEFHAALMQSVLSLPDKLSTVAMCYIENYEDYGEREIYAPLARQVSEITGKDENAMTIKKQWLDAKGRLVSDLARKGFRFLDIEEE